MKEKQLALRSKVYGDIDRMDRKVKRKIYFINQKNRTRPSKLRHLDYSDLQIISTIYYSQKAKVFLNKLISEEIEIKRGVREEYVMSLKEKQLA